MLFCWSYTLHCPFPFSGNLPTHHYSLSPDATTSHMSSTGRICASQTLHFILFNNQIMPVNIYASQTLYLILNHPVRLLILYHKIIDLHVHYLPLSIVMLIFLLICWITKMNNNESNARLCSKPMLTGKYQQQPRWNHHFSLHLIFLSSSL